jgi:predicted negative regulator of RcsB-dependent stress response
VTWLEKYWKSLALGFGLVIVAGFAISFLSYKSKDKELAAQAAFMSTAQKFAQWKEQKEQPVSATPQAEAQKPEAKVDGEQLEKELAAFAQTHSGTVAAQMAGLNLSVLLRDKNQLGPAMEILKKVETKSSYLSNILVKKAIGQLQADLDQCPEAIKTWENLISNKAARFAHGDVRLQQALCYQKLNDFKNAEALLNTVKANKSEGQEQSSQEAERLLRLLKFNQAVGS